MKLKKFGEFETARTSSIKEDDKKINAPWLIDDGEKQILGVEWRACGKWGTVGFVAVKNIKMGHFCVYLGFAGSPQLRRHADDATDHKADAEEIANWGTKQPEEEGRAYFPNLKSEKYKMAD